MKNLQLTVDIAESCGNMSTSNDKQYEEYL